MLRFKVKSRVSNLGTRKGQTLYYASQQQGSKMTLRMVEDQVVARTSLTKGDVRNAIASLAEVVNEALLMGNAVDLGDLGTFRVEATGSQMNTEKEVTPQTIKTPRIKHYPKREMKNKAMAVTLTIDKD